MVNLLSGWLGHSMSRHPYDERECPPIDMPRPIDARLGAKPASREDVVAMDATTSPRPGVGRAWAFFPLGGIDYNPAAAPTALDANTCCSQGGRHVQHPSRLVIAARHRLVDRSRR